MAEILEIYIDESCKDGFKYLAIGGIAVRAANVTECLHALGVARIGSNTAEVKWSSLRKSKLPFYWRFVSAYFDESAGDKLHFHGLYHDTETSNHRIFNQGSSDIGFDKLVYQLLLHKFGRRYGKDFNLHVFLDKRNAAQDPQILRPWLNSDLVKWGVDTRPFRDIRFLDSRKSDLMQVTDLLVGAIGTRKNGLHKVPGAAGWKRELGDLIAKRAAGLAAPYNIEDRRAKRFTLWPFRYGRGKYGPERGFLRG